MDEHTTPDPDSTPLTPDQAADVIRYYNDNENKEYRARGWKDKVPLGQSAIHTAMPPHTILPPPDDTTPTLTWQEMEAGRNHIENPPKSDKYYDRLDELVDKGFTYDDARRKLDAEGMK